jgi:hypothetical protein
MAQTSPRTSGPANVIKQPSIAGKAVAVQPANAAPASVSPHPTAELVQTPRLLARYLVDLESRLGTIAQTAQAGMFVGANLVTGIPVASGTTKTIAHQLGRPIRGRIVTSQHVSSGPAPSSGAAIVDATLASAQDVTKFYAFTPSFTGTVDILFF